MTSEVPQTISLDPVKIPIDDFSAIEKIKIELREWTEAERSCAAVPEGSGEPEKRLVIFLVQSPKKESSIIELNSIPSTNKLHRLLKYELNERFNAKLGASKIFFPVDEANEYANLALSFIGCGDSSDLSESDIRRIVSSIVYLLCDYKLTKVSIVFEVKIDPNLLRFFLESFFLEYVNDERFKSLDKTANLEYIHTLTLYLQNKSVFESDVKKALIYFKGTYFASQLIATPSNYCNPVSLANAAADLAQRMHLDCTILGLEEIENLQMGAYLAVGKGSMYPPRFIHLVYTPKKGPPKKKIALVGKGITFDSGGYNLKASAGSMIELMKFDMSGCAAVLGCAYCIGRIKPEDVEVHFISAVCENMISKNSYRPGDIITASNFKTIEVGNTDAEGRLTLADALIYAEKLSVDYIIDIATLTGAMFYSLGTSYAGVFGTSQPLIEKLLGASKTSNEPAWWLPIIEEYRSSMNSKIADINNVSAGNKASSIIASLFLKEFVSHTPWAHIDIAGVAWNFKTRKPRGFGVRLLTEFLLNEACK